MIAKEATSEAVESGTLASVSVEVSPTSAGGLPDLSFIKAKIPVAEVARELALEVLGNTIRCWRSDNHEHGDRTPSVGIDRKRNRVRCFVCDSRAYSAIDLVQKVLGLDTRRAIAWIAARFRVPKIPKGRHLPKFDRFRSVSLVGVSGSPLEMVIRSGLWAQLNPSEKAVLPVLCELSDSGIDGMQLSYKGIQRFAGIRSDTTVARVVTHLEQMRMIEVRRGMANDSLRACNVYKLTLDDRELHSLMSEIYEAERQEIYAQREMRREQRNLRQHNLAVKKSKRNDLSNEFADPCITP